MNFWERRSAPVWAMCAVFVVVFAVQTSANEPWWAWCVAPAMILAVIAMVIDYDDKDGLLIRWRRISGAPRDGTPVLICNAATQSMRWAVWSDGCWRDGTTEAGGKIVGVPTPTHYAKLPDMPG